VCVRVEGLRYSCACISCCDVRERRKDMYIVLEEFCACICGGRSAKLSDDKASRGALLDTCQLKVESYCSWKALGRVP
jgi:hypothetical protein